MENKFLELLGAGFKDEIFSNPKRETIFAIQDPGMGHDGYLYTCWGLKPLEKKYKDEQCDGESGFSQEEKNRREMDED